jgi:Zinc carboxypeptidase
MNFAILKLRNPWHFIMSKPALLAALLCCGSALGADLSTHAERTGFAETGRYAEVQQLCQDFAAAFPKQVRCFGFGTSPEGRTLWALAANSQGVLSAEAALSAKLPVSLFQGGIHAGEIDGKDAGFAVLRELLQKPGKNNPLNNQVMLFVPIFNVDGHERFQAFNRPNQRGPKEMGWRTTAQNFNLNRDYMKADSPEMQAMLALVNAWDPLFYVDLHVTDGAKFQHGISVQIEPVYTGDEALRPISRRYQNAVLGKLNANGAQALPFYPSFIESDNPASGFTDAASLARFSTGYFQLRNRFAVLVETHSWKTYPVRVKLTADTIRATLEQVAEHGLQWQAAAKAADARSARLGGQTVALDYQTGPESRLIDFQGYAYSRTPSEVSGALMTRYDESKPQTWRIPLFQNNSPKTSITAPLGGYIVPPAFADVVESKLRVHGIASHRLSGAGIVPVQQFAASSSQFSAQSFESHQGLSVQGQWQAKTVPMAANSLYVPINSEKARLIIALLEPQAPDSLLAWGFFNNRFERKEYMEDYVAEEVAREMLKDPAIKAEFEAKLAADPAFAKSPGRRLEFFARQHSSWDAHYQLYPVWRTDADLLRP